jgi:hypothetical protein
MIVVWKLLSFLEYVTHASIENGGWGDRTGAEGERGKGKKTPPFPYEIYMLPH